MANAYLLDIKTLKDKSTMTYHNIWASIAKYSLAY